MRSTRSVLAPTLALVAVLGMSGCTQVSSSDSKSSGSDKASSSETKAADSTKSASDDSSESSSESSEESSSDSSSDSSSSDAGESSSSDSSSESSSSGASISTSELMKFAENDTVRACKIRDIDYVGGGRFCESDSDAITMDYPGQQIYVTVATKYENGAKYTYSGHVGSDSKTNQPITVTGSARDGAPLTLAVPAESSSSSTLTVSFSKNGKQFASKTVKLTKK